MRKLTAMHDDQQQQEKLARCSSPERGFQVRCKVYILCPRSDSNLDTPSAWGCSLKEGGCHRCLVYRYRD
eukprot:scaffold3515_cov78-Skeletonema_dohrnii-CCMP3373.AAC.1